MIAAAVRLPHLERTFSTAWPAAVRYVLPSHEPGVSLEQTWGPVLAWIILRSFPTPEMRAVLFDKLQLRAALAEIFSSMGMEGEKTWQAAAQVRVLLSQADASSTSMQSEEFWTDPDVRWLTGVNTAAGKTYVNKEQFEELLSWLQLPALLEFACQDTSKPGSLHEIETIVARACRAAENAGYNLDTYLGLVHEKPIETSTTTAPERAAARE
jgi:hypothetical protein